MLALAASFCGACVLAFVRTLASLGEPPIRVVFWYGIVGFIVWLPPGVWWWRTPTADCGDGRMECVPYHEWVTQYVAVIGGR